MLFVSLTSKDGMICYHTSLIEICSHGVTLYRLHVELPVRKTLRFHRTIFKDVNDLVFYSVSVGVSVEFSA